MNGIEETIKLRNRLATANYELANYRQTAGVMERKVAELEDEIKQQRYWNRVLNQRGERLEAKVISARAGIQGLLVAFADTYASILETDYSKAQADIWDGIHKNGFTWKNVLKFPPIEFCFPPPMAECNFTGIPDGIDAQKNSVTCPQCGFEEPPE